MRLHAKSAFSCPKCSSSRVIICGHIADNSGWIQCQDCGHRNRPRAFLIEDAKARYETVQAPRPARHFRVPDAGFVCPKCGQRGYFEVDQVLLDGPTLITPTGYDIDSHHHTLSLLPDAKMTCSLCHYHGRLITFLA